MDVVDHALVVPAGTKLVLPVVEGCPVCGGRMITNFVYEPTIGPGKQMITGNIIGFNREAHSCGEY